MRDRGPADGRIVEGSSASLACAWGGEYAYSESRATFGLLPKCGVRFFGVSLSRFPRALGNRLAPAGAGRNVPSSPTARTPARSSTAHFPEADSAKLGVSRLQTSQIPASSGSCPRYQGATRGIIESRCAMHLHRLSPLTRCPVNQASTRKIDRPGPFLFAEVIRPGLNLGQVCPRFNPGRRIPTQSVTKIMIIKMACKRA